jgi:hypothetical protein
MLRILNIFEKDSKTGFLDKTGQQGNCVRKAED